AINADLTDHRIGCLIISVEKNQKYHIRQLHEQIASSGLVDAIKMILYVEHTVNPHNLTVSLWRFCNNLDPKRDYYLYDIPKGNHRWACLGLDGTIKTLEFDGFKRDWPNIIVANDETIKSVDEKWNSLNAGPFIPSPSL